MTVEEQKKALLDLSEKINKRLDETTEQIKAGEKVASEIKDELNKLIDEHKAGTEKLAKELEKANERVDELEVKLQKQGTQKRETFGDAMRKAFQDIKDEKGQIRGVFKFDDFMAKAIMLQSSHLSGDVIQPDRIPGVVTPFERTEHIRPFFAQGETDSNAVDYVEETASTDGTGWTAEGAALGQSDFTLTQKVANVKKIGAHSQVSIEMLEDVAGLMSYIQGRLVAKYQLKEDVDLLFGDGTGANILGVGTNATAWADPGAIPNGNEFDVLRAAVKQAQVAEYFPNLIIIHPNELFRMDTAKDSNGNYLLPYIFNGAPHNIAGVRVIASTAISADNFLVGDFQRGAQIFDRKGLTLEVASEDQDNFIKDLVTVKLTARMALPIYYQGAFIKGVMSTSVTALAT